MYYVVRLAGINQSRKHQVFPVNWMRNSEAQLEKFVQNRINRNQVHIFYWSNETNGNGEPNVDIKPNFDLPLQTSFPPEDDGCYFGQPIHFFCKYTDAVAYKNRLRSIEPAVYNVRRLTETPLPDLSQNNSDENGNENDNLSLNLSNNENDEANHQNDSSECFDELIVSSSSDAMPNSRVNSSNDLSDDQDESIASGSNDIHSTGNGRDEVEDKPQLHLLQRADIAEINSILNDSGVNSSDESASEDDRSHQSVGTDANHGAEDNVERNVVEMNEQSDSDDEIEVVLLSSSFPLPVQYSCDGLIKRDEDPISGDMAFSDAPQVCICVFFCK